VSEPRNVGAASASALTLAPVAIATAWNVQGARAAREAEGLLACTLPMKPNTTSTAPGVTVLWLGPESWLAVSGAPALGDYTVVRDALNAAGGALFDLSESRLAFRVAGPRARDVLASGCPLDFHPRAFAPGACAQSVFARVNALCYRHGDAFILLVARSFGRDVWHGLCTAAAEFGYVTGPAAAWPSV
jgi:sarcosine oxidase subunit gamma